MLYIWQRVRIFAPSLVTNKTNWNNNRDQIEKYPGERRAKKPAAKKTGEKRMRADLGKRNKRISQQSRREDEN